MRRRAGDPDARRYDGPAVHLQHSRDAHDGVMRRTLEQLRVRGCSDRGELDGRDDFVRRHVHGEQILEEVGRHDDAPPARSLDVYLSVQRDQHGRHVG